MQVTIVSIGEKTTNNNFIHKVVAERSATVLGITKTAKTTFYVALPSAAKVKSKHELDLNMFEIKERAFTLPDGPNKGQEVMLKWLHLK